MDVKNSLINTRIFVFINLLDRELIMTLSEPWKHVKISRRLELWESVKLMLLSCTLHTIRKNRWKSVRRYKERNGETSVPLGLLWLFLLLTQNGPFGLVIK